MHENIKSFLQNERAYAALLIIVVGVVSFWLGRVSVQDSGKTTAAPALVKQATALPPSIHMGSIERSATATTNTNIDDQGVTDTTVIASRSGTRYHAPTCPGAKQIKTDNRITFPSPAAAEAAGYTRAQNCP